MRKLLTIIATVAACTFTAYAFWTLEAPPVEIQEEEEESHDFVHFTAEELKDHGVVVKKASAGDLQQVVRAPAQVTLGADHIAHVLPKVSGIAKVAYKNLGEHVEAGEVLAILESREMAEAKSNYLTALKKEQMTARAHERETSLFEKKLASTQDFQVAANDWDEAVIAKELAKQKLHALGLNQEDVEKLPQDPPQELLIYSLRSPIAGQVISRHITPGELIDNDHEIYVIADLKTVWAQISVFPQDRQYVKQGQTVTIATHDGRSTQAKVVYLSPIIDQDTNTTTVIAEIDKSRE